MKNNKRKSPIIDSYDDVMRDYFSSPDVKREIEDWNDWYFSFEKKLDPELRDEFHALFSKSEAMMQKTAEEAMYRGTTLLAVNSESMIK